MRNTRALKPYVPQAFHPHYRKLKDLVLRWTSSPKSYQDRNSYRYNNGLKRFDFFFGFGNIVDIFADRVFGPNFDPDREWDLDFIDRVHAADVREIESGRLKPTHIYAAMMKRPSTNPKFHKHRAPEFSVRMPDKHRMNGKQNVRQENFQKA